MSDAPLYDPKLHSVEDNPTVRLGLYCACGGLWTQVDPVSHCLPQIEDFQQRHPGKGHGPVSPLECLEEREARREAGFRAAGRKDEYKPKAHKIPKDEGFDWSKKGKR